MKDELQKSGSNEQTGAGTENGAKSSAGRSGLYYDDGRGTGGFGTGWFRSNGSGAGGTGTNGLREHESGTKGFRFGSGMSGGLFGSSERKNTGFPWMMLLVFYIVILLVGAFLPGFWGGREKAREQIGNAQQVNGAQQEDSASQNAEKAPEVIVTRRPGNGQSTAPDGSAGTIYASQTMSLADAQNLQSDTVQPEEYVETVSTVSLIEVESVSIAADASWLRQGDRLQMSATIVPQNATDPSLLWQSSDENVAVISPSGLVTAVGGGTAVISATTSNGLVVEYPIEVSYIEKRMVLEISRRLVSNDSVGSVWNYSYQVNGEEVSGGEEMIVVLDDTVTVSSTITEQDVEPDVGSGDGSYTVDEDGFQNGFEMEQEVVVEENDGEYAGNTAVFIVTYRFSPL